MRSIPRSVQRFALVAAVCAASSSVAAQTSTADARVDSLFARWDSAATPGVAVVVVREGQIVAARGYGRASLEFDAPITPRTPFHVASLSKQFTAFAVAMLAEQGRVSLDADIRTYLPELPDYGSTITVRHLVHHTSGLRDQWDLLMLAGWRLDDVITREQVLSMVGRQRTLNFEPGTRHTYSNTGYTLLAEIVSRVTGQPFGEWMRANVFAPLDMRSTHVHDDIGHVDAGRAYSYSPAAGGGWRNEVLSYATVGATSLFTTAEDLALWMDNLGTGRVGGPAVQARMRERGVLSAGDSIAYAFGIVQSTYRGLPMLQHSGADAGFRGVMAYFSAQRVGIAVLSNASTVDLGGALRGLAGIYLANDLGPAPAPRPRPAAAEPAPAPPVRAADYTGTYASEELGTSYGVEASGDGILLRHIRHGALPLTPRAADEFAVTISGEPFTVAFERDAARRVTTLLFSTDRTRALPFPRV